MTEMLDLSVYVYGWPEDKKLNFEKEYEEKMGRQEKPFSLKQQSEDNKNDK